MKRIILPVICSIVIIFMFSACVTQKKFNEVAMLKDKAEMENEQLKRRIQQQEENLFLLKAEADKLPGVQSELRTTSDQLANVSEELADCRKRIEELQEQNRRILSSASDEKQELLDELNVRQIALTEKQQELRSLEQALQERERKLQELNDRLASQDARITALKDKVAQALLGFSANDLSIVEKNGRVYVTLSQNLLFPKGSRVIDKEGVNALTKLAEVLGPNQDIQINVEGHTDSDGSEELNWDLSVNRATSVVKILSSNGVNPSRITASGRAYFDPVAPNDTEPNMTKNRRTEIILSPKLEELWDLIRS